MHLVLATQFDETEEALSDCNYDLVATEADALLQAAGLPLLHHAPLNFKRLCKRPLLAKHDVLCIESDRWDGVYKDHQSTYRPTVATIAKPGTSVIEPPGKPFSQVVKLYFKEHSRADRTDSQIKSKFEKFVAVLGCDRPIASITKADCRTYKEHILKDRSQTTCIKHLSSPSGLSSGLRCRVHS